MKIIKRNGKQEEFNPKKIEKAIKAAFNSVGYSVDNYDELVSSVKVWDGMSIEDIQDQVIETLRSFNYDEVADSYLIYRYIHKQIREFAKHKREYIENFISSSNTANATIDDNANVGTHNIGVLNAEIHKEDNQNTNMYLWEMELRRLYPDFDVKQMQRDFNTILYPHDSSSQILMAYCMAVSMYPFLTSGLEKLGGKSAVPKSLESFCGIYINLVFALASEVKGAVATPEFLMYFDYFARKEWGNEYYTKTHCIITSEHCLKQRTILNQIHQYFQQVTYSINQVAGSRGMQSPFTNFSFFDKYFFEGMFGDFYFPDGTQPTWESVNWLQQEYLHWLNQERLKCILTFPVCSYACVTTEDGEFKDKQAFDFICQEYSEGNSFFTYLSKTVDSLSSCCRLQNAVQENQFNYTNGMVGVQTGSKNVITLNLSRIVQDWCKSIGGIPTVGNQYDSLKQYLINILDRVYKYQLAYNSLLQYGLKNHLYYSYDAGFINMNKQYLTIGVNALNQAAEYLGMKCNNNPEYRDFCRLIFNTIKEQNALHKTKDAQFNTEQTPCESAAIKLYNRDKKDRYWVPSDTNLYASYIFKPNDPEISVLDKIILHSSEFAADQCDGGTAAHLNLSEHLSKTQYEKLLKFAAKKGCKYLTFNIPNCECEKCGFIAKQPFKKCPKCGETEKIALWDRVIGYLVKVKNWSEGRQIEQKTRVYSKGV
jgi:ribonucleoside-triphosphate reductase